MEASGFCEVLLDLCRIIRCHFLSRSKWINVILQRSTTIVYIVNVKTNKKTMYIFVGISHLYLVILGTYFGPSGPLSRSLRYAIGSIRYLACDNVRKMHQLFFPWVSGRTERMLEPKRLLSLGIWQHFRLCETPPSKRSSQKMEPCFRSAIRLLLDLVMKERDILTLLTHSLTHSINPRRFNPCRVLADSSNRLQPTLSLALLRGSYFEFS